MGSEKRKLNIAAASFSNYLKLILRMIPICSASNPRKKKIKPDKIESKAPEETPSPLTTIGIPHITPTKTKKIARGKNIFMGLNNTTMFKISFTVSNAVSVLIVLSPARRSFILIGRSSTKCL